MYLMYLSYSKPDICNNVKLYVSRLNKQETRLLVNMCKHVQCDMNSAMWPHIAP